MKCTHCKQEAIVELRYNGEHLCKNCFCELFEDRVKKNIRVNKLLAKTDKAAVALSGGKDSSVVLYTLHRISQKAPKSKLVAITIDHGIEGYQDEGVDKAKKLCEKLGVEHRIYSFKEEFGFSLDEIIKKARKFDKSAPACTYCGVLRRKLLNRKARELGVDKIATGHNMDDEVQASMMNYIRGDVARMSRMSATVGVIRDPMFVPRIKPLRACPENEVKLYAHLKGIDFAPKRCPYSGEAFRGTVRDAIDKIEDKHPGTKFQILKSTDQLVTILRERKTKKEEIKKCLVCGEPSSGEKCNYCVLCEKLGLKN